MRSSSRSYHEGKNIECSRNRSIPKDKPSDNDRDSEKKGAKTAKDEEKQRKKKNYSSSSSNVSEHERRPACYACEPTGWTVPDSEITDPVYVRDSDSSSFVPLPQAQIDNRRMTDPRIEEHFIGVCTRDEASAVVKPDDFVLYYRKDNVNELDLTIPLYLAHRNTRNELFHFPVVRCTEDNGSKWWYVQIGNQGTRSVLLPQFRHLSDLVRCYHLYRFTDARTGRMEVFPLWKDGIDGY